MRVGVLGGGQLGRMLAQAGRGLGMEFRFLDPAPDACAREFGELVVGAFEDRAALARFTAGLDVATFEFENVPVSAVEFVEARVRTHPSSRALGVAQDRASEKEFFTRAGLEVHPWRVVDDEAGLARAVAEVGVPGVLKTRRGGYDGKGQAVVREAGEAAGAWAGLSRRACIYEALVPFTREVSIVAVRGSGGGRGGSFAAYPLVENRHAGGILRETRAPAAGVDAGLERAADEHCRTLMEALGYVGVLAVEFFELEGRLLANEMAPRVHNSGHWTIEGAVTSQFENHLRAIAGLGLGACEARGMSVMHNLIGRVPMGQDLAELRAIAGAHVHLYGKEGRPGRKVGHVTVCGTDAAQVEVASRRVAAVVGRMGDR